MKGIVTVRRIFHSFFLAGLNLRIGAWYSPAENHLILFCKAEFSPAEESGNQRCQLMGFFPYNTNLGIFSVWVGNPARNKKSSGR
jgi:hypothetical protein